MSTSEELSAQLIYPPNLLDSSSSLSTIKFLASCFTGAAAGILGLQNLYGFVFYVAAMLFTGAVVVVGNCGMKPGRYVRSGSKGGGMGGVGAVWEVVNPGQDNAFTFVLMWTLFYGIVHVYD